MKLCFYTQGGSKNHGCEAIVRASASILLKQFSIRTLDVLSFRPEEDRTILHDISYIKVTPMGYGLRHLSPYHFLCKFCSMLLHSNYFYDLRANKNIATINNSIALSIGGDNYCGYGLNSGLSYTNRTLVRHKNKTVLWGCSIEPEIILKSETKNDLKRYSLITARESITYQALLDAGIEKEKVKLYPDPAFTLEMVQLPLPEGFGPENTVGINVSPLIISCEANQGATMQNYTALMQHIIDTTAMQIALIPHVVWENNDDRIPLNILYEQFKDTGRVVIIEDHNCMELKGYISRCRMFIGARTHATIAAYSSGIPTLVVGYSVKSMGIAKDIFGTYENYVIPVQTLQKKDDLIRAFDWLYANENEIHNHLAAFMPNYIAKAWEAGEDVRKLMETT